MNRLPHQFKVPLMGLIMMPTILLGLPAIMMYRNLPEEKPFLEPWLNAVVQTIPAAFLMIVVVGRSANLLVTRVLVASKGA